MLEAVVVRLARLGRLQELAPTRRQVVAVG
jgi:hypothetical protein